MEPTGPAGQTLLLWDLLRPLVGSLGFASRSLSNRGEKKTGGQSALSGLTHPDKADKPSGTPAPRGQLTAKRKKVGVTQICPVFSS